MTGAAQPTRSALRLAATVSSLMMGLALLVTGCGPGGDEPATVTMPEMNTTTTTTPGAGGPDRLAGEQPEPLPVAWIAQVGGPGDDQLAAVTGSQASVVAVGTTDGLPDIPTAGGTDIMVATIQTSGELSALTAAGSAGQDEPTGVTADGSITVCGSTDGDLGATSGGGVDAFCGSVDATGTFGGSMQLGGADGDRATGVGTSAGLGHAYVSGLLSGLLPGAQDTTGRGLGNGDALMMQVDPGGGLMWARQFGTGAEDGALAVTGDPDGDGLAVGYTDGDLEGRSKGGRDGWISRFDPSGKQRWVTQLGSSGADSLSAVTVTGDARRGDELVVTAGITDADVDAEGPGLNAGLNDAFVAAVASDGALQWITQFGSPFEETVGGVAADGDTIYVTGSSGADFGDLLEDGGPGGARDGFLAAIDAASGTVLWVSRFGSPGDESMTGLATTEDGLLVASGTTTGQMGEDPSAGGSDGFVIAFPLASAGGGAASSV